jgi:addiction module HigA family antidote
MTKKLPPVHPGEVLREEFLIPLKLSAGAVAAKIGVPRTRIERIATEQTAITADTALRLSKFFGTSAQFWINMQAQYDVESTQDKIERDLRKIKRYEGAAA